MAANNHHFRIIGEKNSRAAQIPVETWNENKSKIQELYIEQNKTLLQVVEAMKTEHAFQATTRQFTHRLKLWGIYKQVPAKETQKEPSTLKSTSSPDSRESDEALQFNDHFSLEELKRPRSMQSTGSRRSRHSINDLPIIKKPKITPEESTSDAGSYPTSEGSSSESRCSTAPEDSRSLNSQISEFSCSESISQCPSSSHPINFSRPYNTTGGSLSTGGQSRRSKESELQVPSLCLESDVISPQESLSARSTDPISPEDISFAQPIDLARCLKISRNVGNFLRLSHGFQLPRRTEDRMKVAADYLFALNQFEAAGNIYSVLLVTEQAEICERTKSLTQELLLVTPRLIACVRSARSYAQFELVRHVLLQRMGLLAGREALLSVEFFLAHAFLEGIHPRLNDPFDHRNSQYYANQVNKHGDHMLKPVLDILFYFYYKRLYPELRTSRTPDTTALDYGSSCPRLLVTHGETPISRDDFLGFCTLIRHPNPADEVTRRTDCIDHVTSHVRDCVQWCRSILLFGELQARLRSSYAAETGTIALEVALFEDLWQAWQRDRIDPERPWMMSEAELGVSAAELLRTCSELICTVGQRDLGTEFSPSRYELYSTGIRVLSSMSDRDLLDLHLGLLFDRFPAISERQKVDQDGRGSIFRTSLTPTVAPSLCSSNSSFRRFRDASSKHMVRSIKQLVTDSRLSASRESRSSRSSSRWSFQPSQLSGMSQWSELSDLFSRTSIREEDEVEPTNML